jgi:hypothetical protein
MVIPEWGTARIEQEVAAYLARSTATGDQFLPAAARRLRAWPVYGDVGGVLLVATDGTVYCRGHDTDEVLPEPDPNWRTLAWAAAARLVPELRALLPERPPGYPVCSACGGLGRQQVTQQSWCWCGACWGAGWREREADQRGT